MSGGANTALYVVDDPSTLSGGESAVEGRLTAAGLTVTRIDNTTAVPSDVDDYTIVVVADALNDTNLRGPGDPQPGPYALTKAPLLWMHSNNLNPEQAIADHYLLGSNAASGTTAGAADIVLTVHQSTGSLATGTYTMSVGGSGLRQFQFLAPQVAGADQRLVAGDPIAWTIESCADLRVGKAPNRRAVLGWFGPMLEFANANGLAVLDGMIAWCMAGVPCNLRRGILVGAIAA